MKLSFKQKKRIIYVVTVALIVVLVTGVILSLAPVRAVADDNERINLLNSIIYVDEDDVVSEIVDNDSVSTYSTRAYTDITQNVWSGDLSTTDSSTVLKANFPDFVVYPTSIPKPSTYDAVFNIYIGFVFTSDTSNIKQSQFGTSYNKIYNGSTSNSGITYYTYYSGGINMCIIALPAQSKTESPSNFKDFHVYIEKTIDSSVDFKFGAIGTSSVEVINSLVVYRDSNVKPTNVVYGTDQFTVTTPSEGLKTYEPNNVYFPWDDGYIGFVGRVKTADGVSVPVYYKLIVDGLIITEGEYIILDPAYNSYTLPVTIYGGQSNQGFIELTLADVMDVVYIAVSDNSDLLSEHIVEKANKYQLIQDEINEAYLEGYKLGLAEGANNVKIGIFGNAELQVTYYVSDLLNDIPYEETIFLPINVYSGGIDFVQVWDYYYNSTWYRPNFSLTRIDFNIVFNDGFLWSNDIVFFKFNNTNSNVNMLPYDTYLFTIEDSTQLYTINYEKIGDSYYMTTNDDLIGYSISNIVFSINNQNVTIYDWLVTNQATLYNNIQNWGTNQESYDRGYDDGYVDGVDDGYADGLDQSSLTSWTEGHAAGYDEGRNVGYNIGYEDGLRDDFRLYDLFFSLFDAQLNVFKSVVSFEIFGVNVAGFVLGLVTIGVVAFVIRKVW